MAEDARAEVRSSRRYRTDNEGLWLLVEFEMGPTQTLADQSLEPGDKIDGYEILNAIIGTKASGGQSRRIASVEAFSWDAWED